MITFLRFVRLMISMTLVISGSVIAAGPAVQFRKIGDTPGFPGLHSALQDIVKQDSRDKTAAFCVMLEDRGDRKPIAYAIWENMHLLYRWYATSDPTLSDTTLIHHTPLDLRKDVIRTKIDRLSSFLVTQSWVRNIELQCHQNGELVRVSRGKE